MSKAETLTAIAVDFEPLGNEGRLVFVWPIIVADGQHYVAEGTSRHLLTSAAQSGQLEDFVSPLTPPQEISPGMGFLAFGPRYLKLLRSLPNPVFGAFADLAAGSNSEGFRFLAATSEQANVFKRALAAQAIEVFDDAVRTACATEISSVASAALALFSSEPTLPYEARIKRRLLALRVEKRNEAYDAALLRAAGRLGRTSEEIEQSIVRSFDVLNERVPFQKLLDQKAVDEFTTMAASMRAETAYETLNEEDAWTAMSALTIMAQKQTLRE